MSAESPKVARVEQNAELLRSMQLCAISEQGHAKPLATRRLDEKALAESVAVDEEEEKRMSVSSGSLKGRPRMDSSTTVRGRARTLSGVSARTAKKRLSSELAATTAEEDSVSQDCLLAVQCQLHLTIEFADCTGQKEWHTEVSPVLVSTTMPS